MKTSWLCFSCLLLMTFSASVAGNAKHESVLHLASLPDGYLPLAVNNLDDILLSEIRTGSLYVLQRGKLEALGFSAPGRLLTMNDAGHIVVGLGKLPPMFWNGTKWERVNLPRARGYLDAVGLNNKDEILVLRPSDGEVGVFRHNRVSWLLGKAWGAACVDDNHQIAGDIDSSVSGRHIVLPFIFSHGLIKHMKTPRSGYAGVLGMNNSNQVVGTFLPHEAVPAKFPRDAVLWPTLNGTMVDLNSLLPKGTAWHLATAVSINDRQTIVGRAFHNGLECGYIAKFLTSKP